MLWMYLLQGWFNLSDEGVEDAIYDSYAMRKFMGINYMEEGAPDATTLSGIECCVNRRSGKAYRKYTNDGQAWEKVIER